MANIHARMSPPETPRLASSSTAAHARPGRARSHRPSCDALEAAIANYALAYRMQTAVPELMNFTDETPATQRLYGLDNPYAPAQIFGRECLIARRLVERGVRFIELLCPQVGGDRWDQHSDLKNGHENNARAVDQAIAALLIDLKARGLLETTLARVGRRVRADADGPRVGRPRSSIPTALQCGSPAEEPKAERSTAPLTTTATMPSKTKSKSTTFTPRCCTF